MFTATAPNDTVRIVDTEELDGLRKVRITLEGEYSALLDNNTRQKAVDYAAGMGVFRPGFEPTTMRPYGLLADGTKMAKLDDRPVAYRIDITVNAGL